MSFGFFRLWEDTWTPAKHQTQAPHQDASAEDSATMQPLNLEPDPNLQVGESRSNPEKARKTPQKVSNAAEAPPGMQKTTATMTNKKSQNPEPSMEKTLTTKDSVQEVMVPLPTVLRPSQADAADNQDAQQNDSVGRVTSAKKPMFPIDISITGGASSFTSNTYHTHDKNDRCKDALEKSSDGSRELSTPKRQKNFRGLHMTAATGHSPHQSRHSLMLMPSLESENGSRSNTCHHREQVLFSSDKVPKQKQCHTAGKSFKCEVCEKAFTSISNLHRHQQTHSASKPFKCTFCLRAFTQLSFLHGHERIHSGSKPFKCSFCDRAFTQSSTKCRHEFTHTGTKPFQCAFCDRAFTQGSTKRHHELTHTGSKPFQCAFCDRAFTQGSNKRSHELTHTGSKPFKCRTCEKAFQRKLSCRNHERTHTGFKPFKCSSCEKAYTQNDSLRRHERTHK